MGDGVDFSLLGVDELLGKIDSVKEDVRLKGGRFALRKAANLVAAKAKQGAAKHNDPKTGRSIADNVAVRFSTKRFKATKDIEFRIGVKGGAKPSRNTDEGAGAPTPHWRFIEFGTENQPAEPFMRPALEQNIGAATDEFVIQYGKALDRAIKRAKKKAAN